MDSFPKELIVVGDRVLIAPEDGEEQRTRVGLYLPATAIDSIAVQTGLIINTGPGDPMPDPSAFDTEPWKVEDRVPRTRPMQARIGDHAIFFARRRWRSRSRRSTISWCRLRRFSCWCGIR